MCCNSDFVIRTSLTHPLSRCILVTTSCVTCYRSSKKNASSVNLRHLPRHLPVFHRQLGHHGPETVIIVPPVMSTETGIGIADMTEIDIHLAMSKLLFCLSWLLNFN